VEVIKEIDLDSIIEHLKTLGSGNQADNEKRLSAFSYFYELKLNRDDFESLVFLRNGTLSKLVDPKNRSLRETAKNAIGLIDTNMENMGANWDLNKVESNFTNSLGVDSINLNGIVLRDASSGEKTHTGARYYLQDGCHRSLGYMIHILRTNETYTDQIALVATNTALC
jgi:hypothetical protein